MLYPCLILDIIIKRYNLADGYEENRNHKKTHGNNAILSAYYMKNPTGFTLNMQQYVNSDTP